MELRWYWRVLQRQWRVIWGTTAVVAVLAALFTAYTYYGGRYKGQTTIEFFQQPPTYRTQNINVDPISVAQQNANYARDNAKEYTQGNSYFKAVSRDLKLRHGLTIDWKTIARGLGATPASFKDLDMNYVASKESTAVSVLDSAINVLQAEFLPHYQQTVLVTTSRTGNVFEPPIQMFRVDPPNAPVISLSTTLLGWLEKSLLGVALGIALAFFWEYVDESIHDEQDVRTWLGAPTLGVIPGGKGRAA